MSTRYPEIFAALAAPFAPGEVKEMDKKDRNGRKIRYVTARTVMNRLDEVLGPENWESFPEPVSADSVRCLLTITLPDGTKVRKSDLGGAAGMSDAGDDDKSAASDAFKRAAYLFGVGRYLYGDGVPRYGTPAAAPPAIEVDRPQQQAPAPAPDRRPEPAEAAPPAPRTHVNGRGHDGPPRTGRALFAWTKDREQEYEVGLLKYLNQWAKLNDFPGRMVDWSQDQVELAYLEATRKLASIQAAAATRSHEEALA